MDEFKDLNITLDGFEGFLAVEEDEYRLRKAIPDWHRIMIGMTMG